MPRGEHAQLLLQPALIMMKHGVTKTVPDLVTASV